MIDRKRIENQLRAAGLGHILVFDYETTDSTNTRAIEYTNTGHTADAVFIAEEQTAGRGRLGKSFHSEGGCGLYMTLLTHPNTAASDAASITAGAAVRVASALKELCSLDVKIKWINDLYVKDRVSEKYKKLAGILAQTRTDAEGKITDLYLGLGINVYKYDFPKEIRDIAISLEEVTGKRFSIEDIAVAVTRELLRFYTDSELIEKYRQSSLTLGKTITVRPGGEDTYTARAIEILGDFSLLAERAGGELVRLFSGEVSTEL